MQKLPTFRPYDLVFVYRTLHVATIGKDELEIAVRNYNKLVPDNFDPLSFVIIQLHIVSIDRIANPNTRFIDGVTYSLPEQTSANALSLRTMRNFRNQENFFLNKQNILSSSCANNSN